ncbi:MAG: HD-GYP domain-containing protein [Armatimonadetes bacterium]|nr:HD-GYP domain-containing protein [Armatimonadota bacterium]
MDNKETGQEAVAALVAALEAKDRLTGSHSERVAILALRIGERLGLGVEDLKRLHSAALLHDIGKIAISETLLQKKEGLSDEELARMRLHSVIGMRILEQVEGLKEVAPLIRHHHERMDGQGYPDGLQGEAIPLGARIIAVAETYDILISDMPWRLTLPPAAALEELRSCAGTQFDPAAVAALEGVLASGNR